MNIKLKVIEYLELNKDTYNSGATIAKELEVTRQSIWKIINKLVDEGYKIETTAKGYRLLPNNDVISEPAIRKYIQELINSSHTNNCTSSSIMEALEFDIHDVIGSTSTFLKNKIITQDVNPGHLVISSAQTQGLGRKGRSFYSPQNTGVYLSILLKPETSTKTATLLTSAAAVSVCRAIEYISDTSPKIKWVNDIFIDEKKVAGILTQGNYNMEDNILDSVIVGVGINIYPPDKGFPEELNSTAGWVLDKEVEDARNKYIAAFLVHFWKYYEELELKEFVTHYQDLSLIINRTITVLDHTSNKNHYQATALSIDNDCNLTIALDDGTTKILSAGEISLKIGEQNE